MNPLKEYPHLFAEFDCQSEQNGKKAIHRVWWVYKEDKINRTNWLSGCTLIARPIEDMTDEEMYQMLVRDSDIHAKMHDHKVNENFIHYQQYSRHSEETDLRVIHVKDLCIDSFLYLLSIRVYPFNQSHFDDGTVIDSREI